MKREITRRTFWAVPGAVIAGVALRRPAFACQTIATCIASTDTTVTLRADAGANCGPPFPNQVRVQWVEKPADYPATPINWGSPGVSLTTFAVSQFPANVTVSGLACGKDYVFRVNLALVTETQLTVGTPVEISANCGTQCPSGGCTRTQGYWKNHEEAWPVSSLVLGTNGQTYSKAAALAIFRTPVRGNGLISLAHQLMAAKLNVAAGAGCAAAASIIAAADAKIGNLIIGVHSLPTEETSGLVGQLDGYNNGNLAGCAAHCEG